MNEEKFGQIPEESTEPDSEAADGTKGHSASRARNRTVLLTPEVTGQVRAILNEDEDKNKGFQDPLSDLLPPMASWEGESEQEASAPAEPEPAPMVSNPVAAAAAAVEQNLQVDEKRPTGKMKQSTPESGPSFSVNPNASATPAAQAAPVRSKIVGFLISFDKNEHGEIFEIRVGRWLLTSRPTDHGEYILINDETISPLHAIVRATKDGKIQILDQLSEFGTGVTAVDAKEEEEIAGTMATVGHGDKVRFGERHFVVCLVPSTEE